VINCHTIKPLDNETILKSVKKTGKCLVIQDHQVHGGLGSAVAELLSQKHPVKCEIIGMQDKFGESGKPEQLWDKNGLSAEDIIKKIRDMV
jgi:transketolase